MKQFDGSHDFHHVLRVRHLALQIYELEKDRWTLDPLIIEIAALMHDVGDHKYKDPSDKRTSGELIIEALTKECQCSLEMALKVAHVIQHVSFTKEKSMDPNVYAQIISETPEIKCVQDADRLDAIGAVGVGRTFMFGGAKRRTIQDTLDHFDEKLLHLHTLMKTDTGKSMALERTRRLVQFKQWIDEELLIH
jgi:uncharacterized protein